MQLIDTHCHLQFGKLNARLKEVLRDAKKAEVTKIICVGTTLADSRQATEIASEHNNVWTAAGVHPHDARSYVEDSDSKDTFIKILNTPRTVAVGEIGLDYYKDYCPRELQIKALRSQIEASLELELPYIFHVRDAFSDFWPIFDEYKIKRAVIHSFTAGTKTLNQILDREIYVGLNGIMTFTRDHAQLDAAKAVPLKSLMLETDAPFLTPKPHSGICEPKHVRTTAEFLAKLRGESLEQLADATSKNARELFGI